MLDEIPLPGAVLARVGQQPAHHVELVVARPDLHLPLLARLRVRGLDDLRVVLQDVGQPVAGEHPRPEVVGLEAVRIRRVPGPIVPALVEGQEPRGLAFEVRAELHLVVVHRQVPPRSRPNSKSFSRGVTGRARTARRRPRPSAW